MSYYTVEIETIGDYRISIEYDTDPTNPRTDYDNATTFALFHNRYTLANETELSAGEFNSFDEMRAELERDNPGATILPVSIYDHSGISLSVGVYSGWDSGQIGFAFVTAEQAAELGPDYTPEDAISSDLTTYQRYLNGEAYGFIVEHLTTCDHDGTHYEMIESVWGYPTVDDALTEARQYLPQEVTQ